jgi:hypothetical protein
MHAIIKERYLFPKKRDVLDIGYRILDALRAIGYWVLGIGYWLLGIGYWVLGIGYWTPCGLLGNGYRVLDALRAIGYWL